MRPGEGAGRLPAFRGVLLDWRGTLVVAPTYRWLVRTALERTGRPAGAAEVDAVLGALRAADRTLVESSAIDTDADLHRDAHLAWFAAAGVDDGLAAALYAVESDAAANPFAADVGPTLATLHGAGIRIGVLSDIHVDLRPVFARQPAPGGGSWAGLVHTWVLSYEVGLAKPDPEVFRLALERLGLGADEVLMVGDRGGWDGAAADVGITTLVLPPLRAVGDRRLHRVLDLVLPA